VKILIIDDEQLDLFITKKLLALEYQVEGFTSLPDAVSWASNNAFDVLVSDFYLDNGLNAKDVLKQISAVRPSGFTAFVLSNHIDEQQADDLKKAGFSGVIDKPVTVDKFKTSLNAQG
jgi:DNA-binding NtrC family response regulator